MARMLSERMRVIDTWVNVGMPEAPAQWQRAVAADLFKRPADSVFRRTSIDELLALMDQSGVERAILSLRIGDIDREVLAFAERHPARFGFAAVVDPRR